MSEEEKAASSTRKPKIFKTIWNSYSFFFENFKHMFYVSWPILTLVAVPFLIMIVMVAGWALGLINEFELSYNGSSAFTIITAISFILFYFFIFAEIGWYRACLFGVSKENIANPFKPKKVEIFFFLKTIWFYLLFLFICMFPTWCAVIFSYGVPRHDFVFRLNFNIDPLQILEMLSVPMIVFLCTLTFYLRMSFAFPAKLSGHNDYGFIQSIRQFSGLSWRFTFIAAIALIIVALSEDILNQISELLFIIIENPMLIKAVQILMFPIYFIMWAFLGPFVFIHILCEFYKWREDNPSKEEFMVLKSNPSAEMTAQIIKTQQIS